MVTVPQNQEFQNESLRYENLHKGRKMKRHFIILCIIQIFCVKALNIQAKIGTNISRSYFIPS